MIYELHKDGMPWGSYEDVSLAAALEQVLRDFAHKQLSVTRTYSNVVMMVAASGNKYTLSEKEVQTC